MSTRQPRTGRVSGHLKLIERKSGPIWYVKTRVPGRTPEQTTTFLAPAHVSGGKPPAGHLTRRRAQDALADILTEERHKVGQRAHDHLGATFADAAAGYLHHIEHVRGRERATLSDYRGSVNNYLVPRWGEWPVDAIHAKDVEALRDELMASRRVSPHRGPASYRRPSRASHAAPGRTGKPSTGRRGTGDWTSENREVCVMQNAETVLSVLRETTE